MVSAIYVNARFVTQPLTGVQRYALEVTSRLPVAQLVACAAPLPEYVVSLGHRLSCQSRTDRVAAVGGHLWEQISLPRQVPRDALLWSPGGCGPLSVRNQVLTVHDVAHIRHPEWYSTAFSRWYRWLLPRLARRVRHIITVSRFSAQQITEALGLPEDRVSPIPLGVSPVFGTMTQPDVSQALCRLKIDRPYVLAVGALSPRKNLQRLVAAWMSSRLATDTALVIVGTSGLAFAAQTTGLPDSSSVIRVSGVTDCELAALYNGATVFAFPSLYEGFGLPALEAMACGTPVVCSNSTSLPEVVGDAAILVDPFRCESIAQGLENAVFETELRASLIERGLRHAAQYSWDRTADQTWHLLSRQAIAV